MVKISLHEEFVRHIVLKFGEVRGIQHRALGIDSKKLAKLEA